MHKSCSFSLFRSKITIGLLFTLFSLNGYSWGFFSHRLINKMAVYTIPSSALPFFKSNQEYLEIHAVDADRRKFVSKNEAPKHYIDLEFYQDWNQQKGIIEIPFSRLAADSIYGSDSLMAWGYLPWAIKSTYYQLVEAMKVKNKELVLKLCADLGHYISDCNVPLHTTVNYNGQLSNQKGIHALWETRIPELSWERYDYLVGKASYIDDLDEFIWQHITLSHAQKDSVLTLEEKLTKEFTESEKYEIEEKNGKVKRDYSQGFVFAYEASMNGMVERKLRSSILAVGSLWFTAWVNSGQPALNE